MNKWHDIRDAFMADYRRRRELLEKEGIFGYLTNSAGYVLLVVLVVTPLLVSIAVDFMVVANTSMGYSARFRDRTQALSYCRSGVEIAKQVLLMDRRGVSLRGNGSKNLDSFMDDWAMFDGSELPLNMLSSAMDGTLSIKIEDENAKINMSVAATEYAEKTPFYGILQRFFFNMGLPADVADVIIDWVDPDDGSFPLGAESGNYYQTLTPPYSTKNYAMDSIDELLLLKGITPAIFYGVQTDPAEAHIEFNENNRGDTPSLMEFMAAKTVGGEDDLAAITGTPNPNAGAQNPAPPPSDTANLTRPVRREKSRALSDYLTVYGKRDDHLDEFNKININTAPYRVLSALTDNMTDDIVVDIISRRMAQPFKSADEIKEQIKDETVLKLLSVQSHIFSITCTATAGNTTAKIRAVYNRSSRQILYWSEE